MGDLQATETPEIVIPSNASMKGWGESSVRANKQGALLKIESKRAYKQIIINTIIITFTSQ